MYIMVRYGYAMIVAMNASYVYIYIYLDLDRRVHYAHDAGRVRTKRCDWRHSLWKSDDLPKQHEKGSWKMRKFVLLVACIRLSKRAAGAKGVRVGAKKMKSQQNNRSMGFECFPYVRPEPVLVKSSL